MQTNSATTKLQHLLHKQKFLPSGAVLVVACSGGADSMALLAVLDAKKQEKKWQLHVVHVQHHLRGLEAERDAELVASFCAEHRLVYQRFDVEVRAYAHRQHLSLETAARTLRYEALEAYRQKVQGSAIVTGHHRDDQAETVLLNLVRGTGTKGLRGMLGRNGYVVRPFLEATRAEMEACCREQHLAYCLDSTNEDQTNKRNRVRHELLPLLATYNPQIKKSLALTACLAAEDEACLEELAQNYLREHLQPVATGFSLATEPLLALPRAITSRVLRSSASYVPGAKEITYEHLRSIWDLLAQGTSGKRLHLPGLVVSYAYGQLFLHPTEQAPVVSATQKFAYRLVVPGKLRLPDGRLLQAELVKGVRPVANKLRAIFPHSADLGIIEIRTRQAGDKFRPAGGKGSKKLKAYLIDCKMPQAERDRLTVVGVGQEVLWLVGYRAGERPVNSGDLWLVLTITEEEV